ncbi:MAG: serine/threonine protein kinase [Myxococcales bacterium]|nr:serine/threonine protein kinase [Myxococcales bacterium]
MRQCPKCGTKFWGDSERQCPNDGASLQDVVMANDRTRLLGAVIHGRYAIDGVLGDGGMGVVYRARGVSDGASYAVKVLRAEYSNEEELVARFEVEARAVAAVQHANIVKVFEFGSLEDGSRFFVMELLEGKSLGFVMHNAGRMPDGHRRPLDVKLALKIARQICEGLGAAHAVGIVHRDMKPDNVHLERVGDDATFVKILDFGIAKVAGSQAAKTRTGSVFGTPQYMSPEQAAGERDIDARTDVYATGILLYEMVTGQLPFDVDNLMAILAAHMYQAPIRPRTIAAAKQVDAALEAVLLKALAKDRSVRYQSMAEFGEDIARLEEGHEPFAINDAEQTVVRDGVRASLMPPPIAAAAPIPQATISPVTTTPRKTQSKSPSVSPIVLALGAVGVLSFVGAGAMIIKRSRAQSAAPLDAELRDSTTPTLIQATNVPQTTGANTAASNAIRVDTQPPGAQLSLDGRTVACLTPCALTRPTTTLRYVVSAAGFAQSVFELRPDSAPHIQLMLPRASSVRPTNPTGASVRVRPQQQPTNPAATGQPATTPNAGNGSSPLLHPWQ